MVNTRRSVRPYNVVSNHSVTDRIVRSEGLKRQNDAFRKMDFTVSGFGSRDITKVIARGG